MTAQVVVVGDALLDIDVETHSERLAPDSAAPVLDEVRRVHRPGGAALAARLAARDPGVEVTLVTAIPDDGPGRQLRAAIRATGVRLHTLPCSGATGVKTRLRRGVHTVARLDQGGTGLTVHGVTAEIRQVIAAADVVLVSDYGRGVTANAELSTAVRDAARRRPVVWDPHPRGAQPVPGCRVVTPNAAEAARELDQPAATSVAGSCRQARQLVERWSAAGVAVTVGARGAVLATGVDSAAVIAPPRAVTADPCGAGDRFAARVATALATGALTSEAVAAAVDAATTFLAAGGVTALDDDADRHHTGSGTSGSIEELLAAVRARDGVVVATGGCFDLLHAGHLATLEAARSLGDCLIVCLNSDDSVRRQKGDGRPVQPTADRERVLRGLRAVDAVVVFDEDTPLEVLARLEPDVWVKGGDYAGAELPESSLVRSWGGEVVTVPYLPGRSTTLLVDRARS
jgi:rfaE bifunctional protein nucleotidyltransferase chain/domain